MSSFWKIALFFLLPAPRLHADPIQLKFDSLFPLTQYKKIMTLASQIRVNIEDFQNYKGSLDDYTLLADLITGRMMHLHDAISQLFSSKVHVHDDDIEYLQTILEFMKQEAKNAFVDKAGSRLDSITAMIDNLIGKLDNSIAV